MSAPEIYYWEKMSSPHKAGLLEVLARRGYKVTYVVESTITSDRAGQGWSAPDLPGVRLELVNSAGDIERLLQQAAPKAIHICDGIRSNGMVVLARAALKRHGFRFWVFMETVDDQGWRGAIKRFEYRRLFWRWRNHVAGILTAGLQTTQWVIDRGVLPANVFPFAYFLTGQPGISFESKTKHHPYSFIFVGQLIQRKRVDLLISALMPLAERADFELLVVGAGPLSEALRLQAARCLKGRVTWLGKLPLQEVPAVMAKADCLVLPSRHDGWGAVVSEALMVGTPAICSDHCGAAVVVAASGHGGVFESDDINGLASLLQTTLSAGPITRDQRDRLAKWARCLGAEAGADYLINIVTHEFGAPKPQPPWHVSDVCADQ